MDVAPDTLLSLHRAMLTIRLFEQRVSREFRTGQIPGFVHSYIGEEAVAAGVCAHLSARDYATSTHRGHGHCIAKGGDVRLMMAELLGSRAEFIYPIPAIRNTFDFSEMFRRIISLHI